MEVLNIYLLLSKALFYILRFLGVLPALQTKGTVD